MKGYDCFFSYILMMRYEKIAIQNIPNNVNADEKLKPSVDELGAITNLNKISDRPDMVCWSILFTEDIVALVCSLAQVCMWLMFAMAKESWKPIPMQTNIKLIIEILGSLK